MSTATNSHDRFDLLVDRAIDNRLSEGERRELNAHLGECPLCNHLLSTMQTMAANWGADEPFHGDISPGLADEMEARLFDTIAAQENQGTATPSRVRNLFWLKMAGLGVPAAAAAALVALLLIPRNQTGKLESEVSELVFAPAAEDEAEEIGERERTGYTPNGTQEKMFASPTSITGHVLVEGKGDRAMPITGDTRVATGDLITLKQGARLSLSILGVAEIVLGEKAIMELMESPQGTLLELRRGSGTFRVAKHSPGDAFVVQTPAGQVEVVGTVFEVEVQTTAQVSVRVAQGRVIVRDRADDRNVVPVDAGFGMALDWSDPVPVPLGETQTRRILARFDEQTMASDAVPKRAARSSNRPSGTKPRGDDRIEGLFARAQELRKQSRTAEALGLYRQILDSATSKHQRAEAAFTMGQLMYSTGDAAGAQASLSNHMNLLRRSSYYAMALFYQVKAQQKMGRCDLATQTANRFLFVAPNHRLAAQIRTARESCMNR